MKAPIVALVAAFAIMIGAPFSAMASSHLGPISAMEAWIPWLLLFGVVFFIVAWLGSKVQGVSQRAVGIIRTLGVLFLVLVLVGAVSVFTAPGGGNGPPPPPPPPRAFTIVASVATTAGNTVPSGDFDSCDTEAGGTTGEWTTTEGTFDAPGKLFIARVAIDTDLATTAGLWSEPNCIELDHNIHLNTPTDTNGDGVADAISYFAQITSISRTTLSTDGSNGTLNTQGFVKDGVSETGQWYILYANDAGTYIPACPEWQSSGTIGSSCGPVAVGAHTGTAADDDVDLYIILEDRGLFGYQEPAQGGTVIITYTIAGHNFTLQLELDSRGTTNLA